MKPAAPALAVLLAVGCTAAAGLADPPLAQLARWREAPRAAIAAEPVAAPCPAGNPACAELHALRAEACLGEALATRAPGAACPASRAAPLLDCAAESYAAAIAAAPVARSGAPVPKAGAFASAQATTPPLHLGGDEARSGTLSLRSRALYARSSAPRIQTGAAGSTQATASPPQVGVAPSAQATTPPLHLGGDEARSGTPASQTGAAADDARSGVPALRPVAAVAQAQSSAPALHAGLAQALLCRAELDGPERATSRAAAAAQAAELAPPDLAALHGARAALLLARVGPAPERCAAARRARTLAAAAPAEHRARLEADALLHLRTCEAPPR